MPDFKPAELDGNVWYHVTEGRVDNVKEKEFKSMFQIPKQNGNMVVVGGLADPPQYWQFQPLPKPGRYAIRNGKTGISKQLSVCYNPDELDSSRTQACMARSNGADTQKWDIASWGDGTFRFINADNGTDYYLDVHLGNPVFMSNNIDSGVVQSAQHWLMTSVKKVNEGAYSTIFSDTPTFTTITSAGSTHTVAKDPAETSSDPSKESSSSDGKSGLSAGAAAGVGVGVTLLVIAMALGAYFWYRRRQRKRAAPRPADNSHTEYYGADKKADPHGSQHAYQPAAQAPQELPTSQAPLEVAGDTTFEMDGSSPHSHPR